MTTPYKNFRPSAFDPAGLGLDDEGEDNRQEWLVIDGVSRTRDSECLEESNFAAAIETLGGEGDDVEVHRFGHWGPGWFEIILVRPDSEALKTAEEIEESLENYPVLDDDDFCEREMEEANRVWQVCYSVKERIEYIEKNRKQFEFRDFADMMGCVRGKWFAGYASELIS